MEELRTLDFAPDYPRYGGTVLALIAEQSGEFPEIDMKGPHTQYGTKVTLKGKTGPDKNGQYTEDSWDDSNIDTDDPEG